MGQRVQWLNKSYSSRTLDINVTRTELVGLLKRKDVSSFAGAMSVTA